jgi:hypothetical protein
VELHDLADRVQSRQDLVEFIEALRRDLEKNGDAWENATLDRYLEALAAWTAEMDGYFRNQGRGAPTEPTWQLAAAMLGAARIYE